MLEEMRCGRSFIRTLFFLHSARLRHPDLPILLGKFDMDSAYRRLFVWLKHALLCCTIVGSLAYILLRLPFGSSPAAGEFSLLSDFIADLATTLVLDDSWDPNTFHSDLVQDIPVSSYQSSPQLQQVSKLLENPNERDFTIEVFIDDFIIGVILSSKEFVFRVFHAVPLILHCLFRPSSPDEAVDRPPILGRAKLLAEGTLKESQRILGWVVNTNSMRVFLPDDKAQLITMLLDDFIKIANEGTPLSGKQRKQLESLNGKLLDVAIICWEGRFFLNRLRYRSSVWHHKNPNNRNRIFDAMERRDLIFWKEIIEIVRSKGRSFDHILPTIRHYTTISDAAEHGLGGYFVLCGLVLGWRFELPPNWRGVFSLNLLEFVAAYWTLNRLITIVRLVNPTKNFRVLALSDSQNALAWMTSNKFNPHKEPAHDIICRATALTLFNNSVSLDRNHIKGERNLISDSLSRDTDIEPSALCKLLTANTNTSQMLPGKLKIFEQNGAELSSLLQSMVQLLPGKTPTSKVPKRSDLGLSRDGKNTYVSEESHTISFCRIRRVSKDLRRLTSSVDLPSSCDLTGLLPIEESLSWKQQSDNTSERFVRNLLIEATPTHHGSHMET